MGFSSTPNEASKELSVFIDKVITWAADYFHIKLHYPNEEMLIDLN